jgi:hypothetical protein
VYSRPASTLASVQFLFTGELGKVFHSHGHSNATAHRAFYILRDIVTNRASSFTQVSRLTPQDEYNTVD